MIPPPHVAAALMVLSFGACAGFEATDPGDSSTHRDGRQPLADPSFSRVIQVLFDSNGCTKSSCHGAAQSVGLDLREGNSYESLVNVPSIKEIGKIRVIPGNAQDSYLVIKVEGRQNAGERMPLGGQLDSVDIRNIRNWIDKGAKNN